MVALGQSPECSFQAKKICWSKAQVKPSLPLRVVHTIPTMDWTVSQLAPEILFDQDKISQDMTNYFFALIKIWSKNLDRDAASICLSL